MINNNQPNLTPETFGPAAFCAQVEVRVPEAQADILADSANLANAEATTAVPTLEQLRADIARLWTTNKKNRYELGEKLSQLKQQAKHGEWMTSVKAMDIPHRTITGLISYYREEQQRKAAEAMTAEDLPVELAEFANSDEGDEPQGKSKAVKISAVFKPKVLLKWGDEEKAWKDGIEVIISHTNGVNNSTEAALHAVRFMADYYRRQDQLEIEAIGGPSGKAVVAGTQASTAGVQVAPAPNPAFVIEAVPLSISAIPATPRRTFVLADVDEEVL